MSARRTSPLTALTFLLHKSMASEVNTSSSFSRSYLLQKTAQYVNDGSDLLASVRLEHHAIHRESTDVPEIHYALGKIDRVRDALEVSEMQIRDDHDELRVGVAGPVEQLVDHLLVLREQEIQFVCEDNEHSAFF